MDSMGLNRADPLNAQSFFVNVIQYCKCIFSSLTIFLIAFLFSSFFYWENTIHGPHNIQNARSSIVCYWEGFQSAAGYSIVKFRGVRSYTPIFTCAVLTHIFSSGELCLELSLCQLTSDLYMGNSMVWPGPTPIMWHFFPARL